MEETINIGEDIGADTEWKESIKRKRERNGKKEGE